MMNLRVENINVAIRSCKGTTFLRIPVENRRMSDASPLVTLIFLVCLQLIC